MVQNDSTPCGATIALAGSPPRLLRPLLPKESFSNSFLALPRRDRLYTAARTHEATGRQKLQIPMNADGSTPVAQEISV